MTIPKIFFHGTWSNKILHSIQDNGFELRNQHPIGLIYGQGIYFSNPRIETYPCGLYIDRTKLRVFNFTGFNSLSKSGSKEHFKNLELLLKSNEQAMKYYEKAIKLSHFYDSGQSLFSNDRYMSVWFKEAHNILPLLGYDAVVVNSDVNDTEEYYLIVFNLKKLNRILPSSKFVFERKKRSVSKQTNKESMITFGSILKESKSGKFSNDIEKMVGVINTALNNAKWNKHTHFSYDVHKKEIKDYVEANIKPYNYNSNVKEALIKFCIKILQEIGKTDILPKRKVSNGRKVFYDIKELGTWEEKEIEFEEIFKLNLDKMDADLHPELILNDNLQEALLKLVKR